MNAHFPIQCANSLLCQGNLIGFARLPNQDCSARSHLVLRTARPPTAAWCRSVSEGLTAEYQRFFGTPHDNPHGLIVVSDDIAL